MRPSARFVICPINGPGTVPLADPAAEAHREPRPRVADAAGRDAATQSLR